MSITIMDEVQRCLKCKNPKCKNACPIGTPVNDVMQMVQKGNLIEAGELLFNNNPLSVVCSLVCPHEIQCEGNCVLGVKGNAVHISNVEHYISDYYLSISKVQCDIDPEKRIAIIGSGPAGITIAVILAARGYDITIYEAHDAIGGVLRYGIPEFRLPKAVLKKIEKRLLDMRVKIRLNTLIGPTITIDNLFRDGFKAVFIGTGVWKPNSLGIKGESLGHVHYAMDYLKNPGVYNLGEKVCVIGAGNVAMDVARTVRRNGCRDVCIMYRRGEEDITALKHEVEYAKLDGVKFEFYKTPVEFLDKGIKYMNLRTEIHGDGTQSEVSAGEGILQCSSVIIAIGQGPRTNIISTTQGIRVNERGLVV
ncbi:MAG: NAD(P)-dependent oxidoreductase, partial [Clostridia bacterium]|nr:NAD(P)-dependent oxidoreductase [Clostridia bacterium]